MIDILYQDDALIAVNKPANLAVHRSTFVGSADAFLIDLLREQVGGDVYLAHRLDRATSGVLLVARSKEVAAALGEQFMNRTVHKQYLVVVRGWPEPAEDVIDYPLPGSRETGPRREARTRCRRLATIEVPIALGRYPQQRYALLLAEPESGRFRQIRKHLAHIHHPVIGDCQHGRGDHNRLYKQHFGCHRMLLHAWRIRFAHPLTGMAMEIEAPLDDAFAGLLDRFGWALPGGGEED
ncbi:MULTISPECIES: pseudouridine synthase [Rhodanobacter]|uniref:tRNA pseudouridine synthase C n=1 Tax=Rhodanobacter denitrificans TaxID=666685 RepID=M4NI78_9GAMM|nr:MULTISPECIES: pseudouridine synthase [Rhodanobacter]AGG90655.1 23S RNA-specific pseudouridylate synthase [Rhodanobacter denitrificans]UJM86036.1 pseudouridine synthase [Rhodanobacter denitrificans]